MGQQAFEDKRQREVSTLQAALRLLEGGVRNLEFMVVCAKLAG